MNAELVSNTSGQGKDAEIPEGVRGWSWGAFLLNCIWGIGNGTYVALLMFVPLVNLVMVFVLGARGREWAWRNRRWTDVAHFQRVQRNWSIAALAMVGVLLPLLIALPIGLMRSSDVYRTSFAEIRQSEAAIELLGPSISSGLFVTGQIASDATGGTADISYSVKGDEGEATARVRAEMASGEWFLTHVFLVQPDNPSAVEVVAARRPG